MLTERLYWLSACGQPQLRTRTGNSMRSRASILILCLFLGITQLILVHGAFGQEYQFLLKWGSFGSGDGQFQWPMGIAVDSQSNVYVTDTGIIQKFSSTGEFITKWGSLGSGDGQFSRPYGISVDSQGNVYTVDVDYCRIQKFTSTGEFITKWGSFGSGDGQLYSPFDITVDSSGNVYVSDTVNNRIQKFTSTGEFITKWGSLGSGDGQFLQPHGIAVDSSGNVYVADFNNSRIQKFTSNGEFITKWGFWGNGDGQFNSLSGIAIDNQDNVYVTDFTLDHIQKFTSTGEFITKWGSPGDGDGQFTYPWGIALDSLGNVYVSDSQNYRIQVFGLTDEAFDFVSPVHGDSVYNGCPYGGTRYSMVWSGMYGGTDSARCEGTGGHPGVDIIRVSTDEKIYSIGKGTVVVKNNKIMKGWGKYVVIRHDKVNYTDCDDCPKSVYSIYAHLKSIDKGVPKEGEIIDSDKVVGIMGATGMNGGIHLHLQIQPSWNQKPYWPTYTYSKGQSVPCSSKPNCAYPSTNNCGPKKNEWCDLFLTEDQRQEAVQNVQKNTISPSWLIENGSYQE